MNRRGFLSALVIGSAGLALDPERLLWVPGAKTFFLPALKPSLVSPIALSIGDIVSIDGIYALHPHTDKKLPFEKHFVITADVRSGEVLVERVHPPLIADGPYRNYHGVLTPNQRINPVMCGQTLAVTTHYGA